MVRRMTRIVRNYRTETAHSFDRMPFKSQTPGSMPRVFIADRKGVRGYPLVPQMAMALVFGNIAQWTPGCSKTYDRGEDVFQSWICQSHGTRMHIHRCLQME